MRIGVFGPAPFFGTGYGVQCAHLLHALKTLGHEVAGLCYTGLHGAPLAWDGIPLYPHLNDYDGQDQAMSARHFRADVVVAVTDIWMHNPANWTGVRLVPWFPIDHFPLSPAIAARLPYMFDALTYSQHGRQTCQDAGYAVGYIPCMVDCETFRPRERSEARASLQWPQDRYIVGMVQANMQVPSRKAFWQQLRAYQLFHAEHPDTLLYLHTWLNEGQEREGERIVGMCEALGLVPGQDILFPDQYQYMLGYTPEYLANCYNAMDVLLSVTQGEGFCVPLVEAQACGTPVICGDWTSMGELCFAGWTVGRYMAMVYGRMIDDDLIWGQLEGCKVFPRVSAIVDALEASYQARGAPLLRKQARAGALPYAAPRVASEYWRPQIAQWQDKING